MLASFRPRQMLASFCLSISRETSQMNNNRRWNYCRNKGHTLRWRPSPRPTPTQLTNVFNLFIKSWIISAVDAWLLSPFYVCVRVDRLDMCTVSALRLKPKAATKKKHSDAKLKGTKKNEKKNGLSLRIDKKCLQSIDVDCAIEREKTDRTNSIAWRCLERMWRRITPLARRWKCHHCFDRLFDIGITSRAEHAAFFSLSIKWFFRIFRWYYLLVALKPKPNSCTFHRFIFWGATKPLSKQMWLSFGKQ